MATSEFDKFIINHHEEFDRVFEAFLYAYDQTLENQQLIVELFETDAGKQLAARLSPRLAKASERETKEQRLARTQSVTIAAGVTYAIYVALASSANNP